VLGGNYTMAIEVDSKKVSKPSTPKKKTGLKKDSDGGFRRIKNLDQFPEINAKIKAGVSIEEVSRWIQEDIFQLTDIQRNSLVRQLYRYRTTIPPKEFLKNEQPLFVTKAIEKMSRGINEIDELEKLYLLQLRRISKDAATEDKINKLFKGTSKEIELATELLEKMVKLKLELGILDRQPDRLQVGGLVGHFPMPLPAQMEGVDEKSADKTMTRMGLIASKLFKAIENVSVDDDPENVIDAECTETIN
jgi:hypothetical protein